MSEKEIEKKCPKCGQKLSNIYHTKTINGKERRDHVGYFCGNCGIPFNLDEIN